MKKPEELPEVKKVKTDYENINLTRDQFIEKRAKEKKLAARMEIEKAKIEKELEEEGKEVKPRKSKKEKEVTEEV